MPPDPAATLPATDAASRRPIRGVVFDLDGTLIDSREDIARAANRALATLGFAELPLETIASYVGDGAPKLLERAAGIDPNDARLGQLYAAFLADYSAHPIVNTRVYPGVFETFAALSDYPLALCTNKPRRTTELVLNGLGLEPYFRAVLAGDDLPRRKPDPLPIQHLAERLGVLPVELAVVGDGAQDIEAGRRAGARTPGLRHGIQPFERLLAAGPDHVIESLVELLPLLRL
jgi:phosphoglycolate phosphatase